jgi:hypothetical protein
MGVALIVPPSLRIEEDEYLFIGRVEVLGLGLLDFGHERRAGHLDGVLDVGCTMWLAGEGVKWSSMESS